MVVITVATTFIYSHSRHPPELYSHLASKLLLSIVSSIDYIDSTDFNYPTVFFSDSSYFIKYNVFTESSNRIEVASFGIPLCSLGCKTPSSPASDDKTGSSATFFFEIGSTHLYHVTKLVVVVGYFEIADSRACSAISLSLSLSSFLHSFPNSIDEYRRGMISV